MFNRNITYLNTSTDHIEVSKFEFSLIQSNDSSELFDIEI